MLLNNYYFRGVLTLKPDFRRLLLFDVDSIDPCRLDFDLRRFSARSGLDSSSSLSTISDGM